jgi:hypothetical protein
MTKIANYKKPETPPSFSLRLNISLLKTRREKFKIPNQPKILPLN